MTAVGLSTEHLVEVAQFTGGAVLTCAGCGWTGRIEAARRHPLAYQELRQLSFEAKALADAHRFSFDGRGV